MVSAALGTAAPVVAGVSIGALVYASYQRTRANDPGLTSEVALLLIFLLGAMSAQRAQMAAALFVAVALLLAFKETLHRFTRQVLTEAELGDLLQLAASVVIVLPLLPDRPLDPFFTEGRGGSEGRARKRGQMAEGRIRTSDFRLFNVRNQRSGNII